MTCYGSRAAALYLGLFFLSPPVGGTNPLHHQRSSCANSGALEAIVLIVGLPLAFGPFVYGFYWMVTAFERWTSGVGSFIAARDFTAAELARTIPSLDITLKDVLDRVK